MPSNLMFPLEVSFMGFKAVSLTSQINWLENPYNNRTWMWHLHQMSYITDLVEYDKKHMNNEVIEYSLEIIKSWINVFKNDLENVFAWHDHATALRAQNIIKFYLHLKEINSNEETIKFIEEVLTLHMNKLTDHEFYSKLTNHGLDQSLSLYELANVLTNSLNTKKIKELSVKRINEEISHAFSSDGGHVENSPAYLNFGLKQVLEALSIGEQFEGINTKISFDANIFDNAIKLLAFITQPNGKLPLIGDTKEFEVRNFFKNIKSEEYQNFLYSIRKGKQGKPPVEKDLVLKESGWAIFRESWEKHEFEKRTHIIFKCGFLSNYHRHDDDLSFTLFSDNEEWLIDGGEYKHDPKDPYRIYFRGPDSHNISKPYNLRAHRILEDSKETGIKKYFSFDETSVVEAKSFMFRDFENCRKFSYDRRTNSIRLEDKCVSSTKKSKQMVLQKLAKNYTTYVTKFQIPKDKQLNIDSLNKKVEIIGKNKILTIEAPQFKGNIKLIKGQKEPVIQGWKSIKSGILEECYTLEYYHKTEELNQVFKLMFSNKIRNILSNPIDVVSVINGDIISSTIKTNLKVKGLKYAFYLMYDNEKIEQRWYETNNAMSFKIDTNKDISKYFIIGFIRDQDGKKYQQKSYLKIL